jgi:hypothetical protein
MKALGIGDEPELYACSRILGSSQPSWSEMETPLSVSAGLGGKEAARVRCKNNPGEKRRDSPVDPGESRHCDVSTLSSERHV